MTELAGSTQDDHRINGEVAEATTSATNQEQDHRLKPTRLDDEDPDKPEDISNILIGAQALTGKAAMQQAAREHHEASQKDAHTQQQNREKARQLASLAVWNTQQTSMGGVSMTNEQAQAARKHFIDHEDEGARRAVQMGLIKPGEEDKAKQLMRRKHELKDQEGRGTLTEDGKKEMQRIDADPVLQGTEKAAVNMSRDFGRSVEQAGTTLPSAKAIAVSDRMPAARTADYFDAPDMSKHFAVASALKAPEERKPAPATPAPVAKALEASGLGL